MATFDPLTPTSIDRDGVSALDSVLARAIPGAPVRHAIDANRTAPYAPGGPACWSIGVVSQGVDHHFLTYGLSRAVDADAPRDIELSLRVRGAIGSRPWPVLLLRMLARYLRDAPGGLPLGELVRLGQPVTRAPVPPTEHHLVPPTTLDTVVLLPGPMLPTATMRVQIQNVIALDAATATLRELVTVEDFARELQQVNPSYAFDLEGPSLASIPTFVQAIHAASHAHGSDVHTLRVRGLRIEQEPDASLVRIPPGEGGHIKRVIMARLPFQRTLRLVDVDEVTKNEHLVTLTAGTTMQGSDRNGETFATLSPQGNHVASLDDNGHVWRFPHQGAASARPVAPPPPRLPNLGLGLTPPPSSIRAPSLRRHPYVMAHQVLRDLLFNSPGELAATARDQGKFLELWRRAGEGLPLTERLPPVGASLEYLDVGGMHMVFAVMPRGAAPTEALFTAAVAFPRPRYFTLEVDASTGPDGALRTVFAEWTSSGKRIVHGPGPTTADPAAFFATINQRVRLG